MLNNGHFPKKWKVAKVIPILKKDKDPRTVSSYRPISLLPNLGKVFEILINKSITHHTEKNQIVPNEQFGFRNKSSTTHAITKFSSDASEALSRNKFLAACLINLEKAFDSVWLEGLLFKLIKKIYPDHLIKIIWSMLVGREMFISLSDEVSSREYTLNNGLQQGAVNSPILFNIFICNLLRIYGLNNENCKHGIGFADDLVIYVSNGSLFEAQTSLEKMFRKINEFFGAWKLKCNLEKCETILFRPLIDDLKKNREKCGGNFV